MKITEKRLAEIERGQTPSARFSAVRRRVEKWGGAPGRNDIEMAIAAAYDAGYCDARADVPDLAADLRAARAALERIGKLLERVGCDCDEDHADEDRTHEKCLGCRVEQAWRGAGDVIECPESASGDGSAKA